MTGALVRVGIDSDIFNNAVCGSAVTWDQASIPGVHIQVVCNPPVTARFVSVDNKANATASDGVKISLCEVMVEEVRPEEECPKTTSKKNFEYMLCNNIMCVSTCFALCVFENCSCFVFYCRGRSVDFSGFVRLPSVLKRTVLLINCETGLVLL